MLTQCPQCHTVFRLTPAMLEAAQGRVRCGHCSTVFDALADFPAHLQTSAAGGPPAEAPQPAADATPQVPSDVSSEAAAVEMSETVPDVLLETPENDPLAQFRLSEEELEDVFVEAPASFAHLPGRAAVASDSDEDTTENEILDLEIAAARAQEAITLEGEAISIVNEETGEYRTNFAVENLDPETVQPADDEQTPAPPDADADRTVADSEDVRAALEAIRNSGAIDERRGRKTLWAAGSALLAILLAAQLVHFNRQALVRHPAFGPVLVKLYALLGIELHPAWDLGAYQLRQWGAAADATGALRVRASLFNGADRAQPYPLLRLTLQDRFGERVSSRDLEPREYLPSAADPPASTPVDGKLLAAGQRVDADIAVVDPGKNTVGFELDVCLRGEHDAIRCANDASVPLYTDRE